MRLLGQLPTLDGKRADVKGFMQNALAVPEAPPQLGRAAGGKKTAAEDPEVGCREPVWP